GPRSRPRSPRRAPRSAAAARPRRSAPLLRSRRSFVPPGFHTWSIDDAGNRDNPVPAHHERPRLALGSRDLGVDEHVLDLLAAPGEPAARSPASYLKACEVGLDRPRAPADASLERYRRLLEPDALVFADRREALAEVHAAGAFCGREQLVQLRRPLLREAEEVLARRRGELAQQRKDAPADEAALRVRVGRVRAVGEPLDAAVGLGLLAPELEQRTDDSVLALRLDPARGATRRQAVEDGLYLVGGGVASGAEPVARE